MLQNYDADKLRTQRTALATALKLFFRFQFGGLQNLESVISFLYSIPIFTAAFPFKAVIRH